MNPPETRTSMQALVIGGSAGAVGALLKLLPWLPGGYPLPVLIVIHLPPDDRGTLAGLLNSQCQVTVKEAEDKEPICPGVAYVAPANYHLLVEPDFSFSLSQDEPLFFSRPSIDVLFESAADAYGSGLSGVILTGASQDGAHGLLAVHSAGGRTFVQEPATAEVSTMPLAALSACPEACALPLNQLAEELRALARATELYATLP
ncbi:chemotaxis protein CheB [Prosthecobacter sp.]|uniref:chemotaxis protein CheB n=1 Tax=Prosthecobacter sp. TaxID=1965333 RepID=UPI002489FC71|nr:chemotaxis protein CheB [Prosthecobacter sp.]MDI1313650.1 chemotaxis protein CheB [Prosthecobacter sp.]